MIIVFFACCFCAVCWLIVWLYGVVLWRGANCVAHMVFYIKIFTIFVTYGYKRATLWACAWNIAV